MPEQSPHPSPLTLNERSRPSLKKRMLDIRGNYYLSRLQKDKLPGHVAIIMDGNGRWAEKKGLPRLEGHRSGVGAIRDTIESARETGIRYLTLFTFSSENWRRPADEVEGLMNLFKESLEKELPELHREGVRIRLVGDRSQIPETTVKSFEQAEAHTVENNKLHLQVAINYGGRKEILKAAENLCRDLMDQSRETASEVDEQLFSKYLYTSGLPDPDLLIRSGGEYRVSNFLLWQIAYSELWITPVLWPDFRRRHFLKAIYEFQKRKRRYGGIN